MSGGIRVGVDVGGTFTDIVGVDDSGRLMVAKTSTTPEDLAEGVLKGVGRLCGMMEVSTRDVGLIIHGTTIGTNALLERKGVTTGLLTTAGFRDILEIGRVQRPAEGLYDFNVDNPIPLVPRRIRLEASERIDSSGRVVKPLDEDSVVKAARRFKDEKVSSVAVCFLFSFLNPDHERIAREILLRELPGVYVSISSDISPEFREFERTSTTTINSYIGPLIDKYVDTLEGRIGEKFPSASLRLIQANGGSMRAQAARGRAVNLINSGPAGGATAAAFLGSSLGIEKVIAADMGGTSFDVSLIEGGAAAVTTDSKFEGFPIKVPMCDVTAVGAGGGSIAWIDTGGVLNVGPQSAGAMPGPVCYCRGGELPTVTDANVVLGRINPDRPMGGEIKPDKDAAQGAISRHVGEALGMSCDEAAWSIIRIINARMAKAVSIRSTQRGHDLREFSFLSFGGAGPLHAVEIAKELGIPTVIIPPHPGVFSAFGLLIADTRYDFVRAFFRESSGVAPKDLWDAFVELSQDAVGQLEQDGVEPSSRVIRWSADLRFEGQSYELNVPVGDNLYPGKDGFSDGDLHRICSDFEQMHEKLYEIKSAGEKIHFVSLRVAAIGRAPGFNLPSIAHGGDVTVALKGRRKVYFGSWIDTDIYDRYLLGSGCLIEGPSVVEEENSCTVIPPGCKAKVDEKGNIIISVS